MTTKVPQKPAAAGVAANAAVVLVWVANQFDLEIPPEVAAAFTSLLASVVYFFTPSKEV